MKDRALLLPLILLFAAAFIDALDSSIVNVALPVIAMDYDETVSDSSWVSLEKSKTEAGCHSVNIS